MFDDLTLPPDSIDDLPITAVMQALSGRTADAARRRTEIELSIRSHWAALTRLVVEHSRLSVMMGEPDAVPDVTRFIAPQRPRDRTMQRPGKASA